MKNLTSKSLASHFISEDAPRGDITTAAIFGRERVMGRGVIRAKENLVLSGLAAVKEICLQHFPKIKTKFLCKDGEAVTRGAEVAILTGPAQDLLLAERTVLNLLQRMSGIATLTRKFVILSKPFGVKILDTRKTTPGLRDLEKRAVKDGGGENHRMNLSDQYLIKDNHIDLAGSAAKALELALAHRRKKRGKEKIEIEVRDLRELEEVLRVGARSPRLKIAGGETPPLRGADIILLDNMTTSQIRRAVKMRDQILCRGVLQYAPTGNHRVELEISGGVNLKNIKKFLPLGVDRISIGALTHSAVAVDLSMKIALDL